MKEKQTFVPKPYIVTQLQSFVDSEAYLNEVYGYEFMTLLELSNDESGLNFHMKEVIITELFKVNFSKDRSTYYAIESAFMFSGDVSVIC